MEIEAGYGRGRGKELEKRRAMGGKRWQHFLDGFLVHAVGGRGFPAFGPA